MASSSILNNDQEFDQQPAETLVRQHFNSKPGWLIWQLNNLWQRKIAHIFQNYGLTNYQFFALKAIYILESHNQKPNQSLVAELTGSHKMLLSSTLKELENKNWIVRHIDPVNSRFKLISLVKKQEFEQINAKITPLIQQTNQDFFDQANVNKTDFIRILQQLIAANT